MAFKKKSISITSLVLTYRTITSQPERNKRFLYFNLHCSLSRDDKLISRITRTYHLWLIPVPPQNRTETDHVTCQRFWSRSVDLCIRKRISNLKYKFVYYFESNFRYIYIYVSKSFLEGFCCSRILLRVFGSNKYMCTCMYILLLDTYSSSKWDISCMFSQIILRLHKQTEICLTNRSDAFWEHLMFCCSYIP